MGNKFSNLSVGDCDQESLLPLWDLQGLASQPYSIYLQVISKCALLMILPMILLVLLLMLACILMNEDSGRCESPWLWGLSSNMVYTSSCYIMVTFFSWHLSKKFVMLNLSFIMQRYGHDLKRGLWSLLYCVVLVFRKASTASFKQLFSLRKYTHL
jgi:hypothetical protein